MKNSSLSGRKIPNNKIDHPTHSPSLSLAPKSQIQEKQSTRINSHTFPIIPTLLRSELVSVLCALHTDSHTNTHSHFLNCCRDNTISSDWIFKLFIGTLFALIFTQVFPSQPSSVWGGKSFPIKESIFFSLCKRLELGVWRSPIRCRWVVSS